jgi:hypothetical protein
MNSTLTPKQLRSAHLSTVLGSKRNGAAFLLLCAVYRIIQYEKYGQEGTGFFHNRLEVKDTATCLEVGPLRS